MADNMQVTPGTGATVAADEIGGALYQRVKIAAGADGTAVDVSAASPLPVSGPVTDTQLRASPVPVSGPLTDTELRASAVPVSGTVTASGPLTDTQLRASAVPVSGTVTASGPVTNTELRAAPVTTSDSGPSWTQVFGVSGARFTSADASTAAAVTDAPTSGQKLVIDDIVFAVGSTAMRSPVGCFLPVKLPKGRDSPVHGLPGASVLPPDDDGADEAGSVGHDCTGGFSGCQCVGLAVISKSLPTTNHQSGNEA